MAPNASVSLQYLLKDYKLGAGDYVLRTRGKAPVCWKYYPNLPPASPPRHKEGDPVPGAAFDVSLPIIVTPGSREELQRAYAPYIAEAEGVSTGMAEMGRAREAIAEMAPEFLEKTIGFATGSIKTPALAVKGLGQIDTSESRADLIKLYDISMDLGVRDGIVYALANMATADQFHFFAELLPGRSTPIDDQIRRWAALGLGHIGGDDARVAVAVALSKTKSKAAVPLLIQMYSDNDNTVTNAVCGALKQLTHYEWCDGSGTEARVQQARWRRWWKANAARLKMYGSDECPSWKARLASVH